MPQRWKVCATPGCPELTTSRRCPTHTTQGQRTQAAQRRHTGDQSMDTYSTTAWRRTRARFLRDHPDCAACGQPATDADHVAPRRILEAAGIRNPDTSTWLQPLCGPCHSRKTTQVDTPMLARLRAGEPAEELAALALDLGRAKPT